MAVRIRGKSFQVDFSFRGQRVRKDGFTSKVDAENWEAVARGRISQGLPADPDAVSSDSCESLTQLLQHCTDHHWAGTRNEAASVINATDVVNTLGPSVHPSDVTPTMIDRLIQTLEARVPKLKPATINRKLAALSKMLNFAKDRGWVSSVPKIRRKREAEHRIRWYTPDEEKTIINWFNANRQEIMADLTELLIDTGMRLSEALRLEYRDAEGHWVRIWDTKNGKPRSVPMSARVVAIIARRRAAAPASTHVFAGLTIDSAEWRWEQMRREIRQDHDSQFVMHTCRHTFGSRLAMAGVDSMVIKELMGHKSITITQRYAHLSKTSLVDAMSKVSQMAEKLQPAAA
jgi:integrase